MNKTLISKIISSAISIFVLSVFFFLPQVSKAAVLLPGNIASCGELAVFGTYTLANNVSSVSGTCFIVTSNDVTINGAGFTVTAAGGNTAYAVTATSTSNGGSAYGTTTIQNITFSGFGGGVNASGKDTIGLGSGTIEEKKGGNAGSVVIASSTMSNLLMIGGNGDGELETEEQTYPAGNGGEGGNLSISSSTVTSIDASAGLPGNYFLYSVLPGKRGVVTIVNSNTGNINQKGYLSGGFLNIQNTNVTGYLDTTSYVYPGSVAAGGSILIENNSTISGFVNSSIATPSILNAGNITILSSSVLGTTTASYLDSASGYNGTAGTITIATSTTANVFALSSNNTSGGAINVSDINLDLSNKIYSSNTLNFNYSTSTGSLTTANTLIYAYRDLIINQISFGQYTGGAWPNDLPDLDGITDISSCRSFNYSGVYVLTQNISNTSGVCFEVKANNVTVNGAGYSVTAAGGNSSYAITATSSTIDGGSAYGTTTIQNITFSGFGGGINASGNNGVTDLKKGGDGGSIVIASSTVTAILADGGVGALMSNPGLTCGSLSPFGGNAGNVNMINSTSTNVSSVGGRGGNGKTSANAGCNAGLGGNIYVERSTAGVLNTSGGNGGNTSTVGSSRRRGSGGNAGNITNLNSLTGNLIANGGNRGTQGTISGPVTGGTSGTINITGENLNISNILISSSKGVGAAAFIPDGTLNINYTGGINSVNSTVSNLSSFSINGLDLGVYSAGPFPLFPGNINSCGKFAVSGLYTLTQNIINANANCFEILANNVVFDGSGYTVESSSGNIAFNSINSLYSFGTTTLKNINLNNFNIAFSSENSFINLASSTGSIVIENSNISGMIMVRKIGSPEGLPGTLAQSGNIIIRNSLLENNIQANTNFGGSHIIIENSTLNDDIYASAGSNSGSIKILNSTVKDIDVSMGSSGLTFGSMRGGNVYIATSTVDNIFSNGGQGQQNQNNSNFVGFIGGQGGLVEIYNSNIYSITSNGGQGGDIFLYCSDDCEQYQPGIRSGNGGQGGVVNLYDSIVTGSVSVKGGSDTGGTEMLAGNGGQGGVVAIEDSSVIGTTTAKGGNARGTGGVGGEITLTYATTSLILLSGGDSTYCGDGGIGGVLNMSNESSYNTLIVSGGLSQNSGCTSETKFSGGSGSTVSFVSPPRNIVNSNQILQNNSTIFSGTVDKAFIDKIKPIISKDIKKFNIFNNSKISNIGNTVIPSIFKDFKAPTLLDFKVLQTNFLKNVIKFVLDKDNDPKIYTVKSNNRVISSKINYDKKTDTATQSIQAQPNQQLDINVNTKEETLNGTFNGQSISLNKGYLSVTLPKISGTYILKIDGSRTALYVNVIEPVSTVAPEVKRSAISNLINKIKSWFR